MIQTEPHIRGWGTMAMFTFANQGSFGAGGMVARESGFSLSLTLRYVALLVAILVGVTAVDYLILPSLGGTLPVVMSYLLGVIASAAWCGAGFGILSAFASVILCNVLISGHPFAPHIDPSQAIAHTFLFCSAAMLVGSYSDLLRQKSSVARLLADARSSFSDSPAERSGAGAKPSLILDREMAWWAEGQNIAVAFLMVGCGLIFTAGFQFIFQFERGYSFFVAAVLITAITRGARAALFAAVVSVVVFNIFTQKTFFVALDKPGDLLNLLLLSAIAWWVGGYADHVRHGRQLAQSLFEAGEVFSTIDNEMAVRRILHRALSKVCNTSSIWVIDEHGRALDDRFPVPHLPVEALLMPRKHAAAPQTIAVPPWYGRSLQAGESIFGAAIWFNPAVAPAEAASVQKLITVLIDLAAGAIARARLTAQQIDMQFVAQTEKLRTALLSSISHDFRTPLSGILGAATGLLEMEERCEPARQRDLLVTIKSQAIRLNRYVENLLSMTQYESGILRVNLQPVIIEPIIYDVWEGLEDFGGALRILDVRLHEEASAIVDHVLFRQVLTNLFENAIKYTPEGATVIVRGRTAGRSQILEIVDSGSGIRPEDLPRVFERFYRGDRQTATGLGLGLYITRCLLEAMGATIEARNRSDGKSGLIVSISMPISEIRQ